MAETGERHRCGFIGEGLRPLDRQPVLTQLLFRAARRLDRRRSRGFGRGEADQAGFGERDGVATGAEGFQARFDPLAAMPDGRLEFLARERQYLRAGSAPNRLAEMTLPFSSAIRCMSKAMKRLARLRAIAATFSVSASASPGAVFSRMP